MHLARFVREGLPPPPSFSTTLTPQQARGKEIFERRDVGCTGCHAGPDEPAIVAKLPKLPLREGFDEEDSPLKAPNLRFVGGTPPYLHDGSEPSLLQLLRDNRDRMGHTTLLTEDDLGALAAYLETL